MPASRNASDARIFLMGSSQHWLRAAVGKVDCTACTDNRRRPGATNLIAEPGRATVELRERDGAAKERGRDQEQAADNLYHFVHEYLCPVDAPTTEGAMFVPNPSGEEKEPPGVVAPPGTSE